MSDNARNKANFNHKQFRASPVTQRRLDELQSLWGTGSVTETVTRAIAIAHTIQTNPKFKKLFNEMFVMVR